MATVSIEEAQAKLPELIDSLSPGEELIILRDDRAVAKLIPQSMGGRSVQQPGQQDVPVFGRCKGMLSVMSEDDEHLKDFEEYMS